MSTESLPPFYVGQRVVAVKDVNPSPIHAGWKKDDTFIIKGLMNCCKWKVDIGVACLNQSYQRMCMICKKDYGATLWFPSNLFEPIQENFQSISLSKVLEEETKLISVN